MPAGLSITIYEYRNNDPFSPRHVPVMGLAFTVDSPVKVVIRFGISSVMSIIEDRLLEMMRNHYYSVLHEPYRPSNPMNRNTGPVELPTTSTW